MSQSILNVMRGEAQRVAGNISQTRYGVVDGIDVKTHTVRVRVQPEDNLTGWLPVMALSVGAGWGLHAMPAIGTQVVVGFQEGSIENGVVMGAVYSRQNQPPATPAGAIWLVSKNGAKLKLNADGTVDLEASQVRVTTEALVSLLAETLATLTAPDIQIGAAGAALKKLLNETAAEVYNQHTHAGNGSPPAQKMTAPHLTTNLKAS